VVGHQKIWQGKYEFFLRNNNLKKVIQKFRWSTLGPASALDGHVHKFSL